MKGLFQNCKVERHILREDLTLWCMSVCLSRWRTSAVSNAFVWGSLFTVFLPFDGSDGNEAGSTGWSTGSV